MAKHRRFGAYIPVYNDWRFVPTVVNQLLKVADECLILWGERTFSGVDIPRNWEATEKWRGLIENTPYARIYSYPWKSEAETRNYGLFALKEYDYVFTLDADEIYLDKDLFAIRDACLRSDPDVVSTRLYTYWKTGNFRIDPPEDIRVRAVVKPGFKFEHLRTVHAKNSLQLDDVWCHHLSYVRTDEEIQEKLRSFSHAHEIVPQWYERIWKKWDRDRGLENLHPTAPSAYKRAVFLQNPELETLLVGNHGWLP